jgi:sec-independent protein translocase protein TatA
VQLNIEKDRLKRGSFFLAGEYPTFVTVQQLNKVSMYTISSSLLISMPGGTEWVLIVLAILILFGGRKIPEFMRGIGKGIREFNDAKSNVKKEIEEGMNEKERP